MLETPNDLDAKRHGVEKPQMLSMLNFVARSEARGQRSEVRRRRTEIGEDGRTGEKGEVGVE